MKIMTLEYEDDQVKERGSCDVGFSKGDRIGEEEDCILELIPIGVLFGRIIFKDVNLIQFDVELFSEGREEAFWDSG